MVGAADFEKAEYYYRTGVVFGDEEEKEALLAIIEERGFDVQTQQNWPIGQHVSGLGHMIIDFRDKKEMNAFHRIVKVYGDPENGIGVREGNSIKACSNRLPESLRRRSEPEAPGL